MKLWQVIKVSRSPSLSKSANTTPWPYWVSLLLGIDKKPVSIVEPDRRGVAHGIGKDSIQVTVAIQVAECGLESLADN